MKICKKTLIIFITLIILLYSIIPPKTVQAADSGEYLSSKDAGQIIADFAQDMVENHADETIYDFGDYWLQVGVERNHGRIEAYYGNKVTGYAQGSDGTRKYDENKYFMDCVGFVTFCIHHSLGIDGAFGEGRDRYFVTPTGIKSSYFYDATGEPLQNGDILIKWNSNTKQGHVMIYVGPGYVAEAQDTDDTWQVKKRNSWPTYTSVARIKDGVVLASNTKSSIDGVEGSNKGIITPTVDDTKAFEKYISTDLGEIDVNGRNNSTSFYYNGTPKKGEYLGKEEENWLFNTLNDVADWLLGIITMNIKIQVIGWTSIFEYLANQVVEAVTDTESLEDRITVEDVIYNRVPILDVNLFNFEKAGGQDLEKDNLIYMLRQKIANWYVAIRTICIIILLFTLIYLAIRTAIDSVAKEKAGYKEKLISWVVSFIIVMFIHYFMIFVLNINETALSWVEPNTDSSASIYEQMRAYAYEIPATKGWTGTIIYVFLVYYLIKMLFFYFKRLLIVYTLAIISPAMGIAYSIQKINGKSKALGVWVKEFTFNVIIQFVHALIYTVFMGLIVQIMSKATAFEMIPYAVLLIVLLNFVLEAEDIIKNIFKIQSNSLKSVIKTAFSLKNNVLPATIIGGAIYRKGKSAIVNAYDKSLTNTLNEKYDKYKIQGDDELAQATNAEIERLKQQEKEHTMALNKASIDFAKDKFKGAVSLVTGVPAVFEEPMVGIATLTNTASSLGEGYKGSGSYAAQAQALESSTDATNYIYIDDPNQKTDNGNNTNSQSRADSSENEYNPNGTGADSSENGASSNGTGVGSGGSRTGSKGTGTEENETKNGSEGDTNASQKTIRKYNTKKNKEYKFSRVVLSKGLSWLTVGESKGIKSTLDRKNAEKDLLEKVYSTRIEKVSVIGNIAVKEVGNINKELDKIKTSDYPPIYYTPKPEENDTQRIMNETLREKYRLILKKNITQIYEGVDKQKVAEHIDNYNKISLDSVRDISKSYLAENECNLGEDFEKNFEDVLRKKIIDTVNENKNGFERIKLNQNLEEKLKEAIKDNSNDEKQLNEQVDKIVTEDVKENIVSKISVKDLTELISSTLDKKGSVEMNKDFKNLQEPIENLRDLNKEAEATIGKEIYTTEQIINLIMNKDITN